MKTIPLSPLKNEALAILSELALLPELQRLGEVKLVGSVALDLIVKLDIDLHVLLSHTNLFAGSDSVYHYLLDQDKVREVRITDWRSAGGIKLGIDAYPAPAGDWSIDIWVTNQRASTAFDTLATLQAQLTTTHRQTIMEIKRHYHANQQLRDGLSIQIYQAVLDAEVRSVEEFEKYRENYA